MVAWAAVAHVATFDLLAQFRLIIYNVLVSTKYLKATTGFLSTANSRENAFGRCHNFASSPKMRPADTTQFISFPSDLEGTFLLDEPLPALDESLETPRPSRKKEKRQPLQNAPINIPSISPICTKERLDEQDPTLVNTKHQSFDPPQQSLLIEVPTTKVTTVRRRKAVASSLNIEPTQRFVSLF
jgi:hypothetical protein